MKKFTAQIGDIIKGIQAENMDTAIKMVQDIFSLAFYSSDFPPASKRGNTTYVPFRCVIQSGLIQSGSILITEIE